MSKSFHLSSFACGLIAAAMLACIIGAAGTDAQGHARYDAYTVLGGIGLQITDHDTGKVYMYRRNKKNDLVTLELFETVDLSLTGQLEIPVKSVVREKD